MFLHLLIALLCQPGLSQGIVPGMTRDQVEARLNEGSSLSIGFGPFGSAYSSTYRRSKLSIFYKLDIVQSVEGR